MSIQISIISPHLDRRRAVVALSMAFIALLSGCASRGTPLPTARTERTAPASPARPTSPQASEEIARPTTAPEAEPSSEVPAAPSPPGKEAPAILALMEESEASRASGDLDSAAAGLERGIRIQPRNAQLWHDLAQIRLQQGQASLAEQLATKSLYLAMGNEQLLAKNKALIAEARRRQPAGTTEPDP